MRCCKSINMSQNYFGDPWNCFDFIIVMGSFIDIVYGDIVNVCVASNFVAYHLSDCF